MHQRLELYFFGTRAPAFSNFRECVALFNTCRQTVLQYHSFAAAAHRMRNQHRHTYQKPAQPVDNFASPLSLSAKSFDIVNQFNAVGVSTS